MTKNVQTDYRIEGDVVKLTRAVEHKDGKRELQQVQMSDKTLFKGIGIGAITAIIIALIFVLGKKSS